MHNGCLSNFLNKKPESPETKFLQKTTITFPSKDSLPITADIYNINKKPINLLCI